MSQQDTAAPGEGYDFFKNTLDAEKFRLTNAPWNELCLNDPWSVGIVTNVIELRAFKNKEEWEEFYYKMGDIRLKELSRLDEATVAILEDELLVTHDTEVIDGLDWTIKNINFQNGRTRAQLDHKGSILYNYCQKKGIDVSEDLCKEAVRFRVICETWNGIMVRERNTIAVLSEHFGDLRFEKTDGAFDHQYAVDYELWQGDQRLCGIQVKPASYFKSFAPYIKRAKAINALKNREYKKEQGLPVFEVVSDMNGTVLNHDVFSEIANHIEKA